MKKKIVTSSPSNSFRLGASEARTPSRTGEELWSSASASDGSVIVFPNSFMAAVCFLSTTNMSLSSTSLLVCHKELRQRGKQESSLFFSPGINRVRWTPGSNPIDEDPDEFDDPKGKCLVCAVGGGGCPNCQMTRREIESDAIRSLIVKWDLSGSFSRCPIRTQLGKQGQVVQSSPLVPTFPFHVSNQVIVIPCDLIADSGVWCAAGSNYGNCWNLPIVKEFSMIT